MSSKRTNRIFGFSAAMPENTNISLRKKTLKKNVSLQAYCLLFVLHQTFTIKS
tara:strand:+ start:662 stop:820 length:159 start_codon:yes stop_codon:yes gene_type:complete